MINQPQQAGANSLAGVQEPAQTQGSGKVDSLGDSLFWLTTAIIGALLTALPVAWTYMAIRHDDEYDQSLISTIVILPLVVTGIVVIVQNSLARRLARRHCGRGPLQNRSKARASAVHPAFGRHRLSAGIARWSSRA